MTHGKLNEVIPFQIKFEPAIVESLQTLLSTTKLPTSPPISAPSSWSLGVDLPWLTQLKAAFEDKKWRVDDLEKDINRWPNYLVRMKATESQGEDEEVTIHFLHVKSPKDNAIPLMMLHGWPGTFWDFKRVIEPLTNPEDGHPAFDVVIPSLPGYFLSTYPQRYEWSLADSASLLHRLMTQVLGYSRYAAQGGDWGSYMLRVIGALYPTQAPLLHFNMFRCPPVPNVNPLSLTNAEKHTLKRSAEFNDSGKGYSDIQSTKPFTIGIALSVSPVSLLAYIGEKMYSWSDPSRLDGMDVLETVALYYLSQSFPTSVMIYHQSQQIKDEMRSLGPGQEKWRVKSKIGFTLFPYEIGGVPRAYIKEVGPLVFYKERDVGGHFPALDNPEGLVDDIREFIGENWSSE